MKLYNEIHSSGLKKIYDRNKAHRIFKVEANVSGGFGGGGGGAR